MKTIPELSEQHLSRFNRYILKTDSCWNWTGTLAKVGYPVLNVNGTLVYGHRIAYFLKDRNFDQSMCVLHSCDNRKCVNPSHLFLGTRQDNMQDKVSKNRQSFGEMNTHTLTEQDIIEIKQKYATGKYTQRRLGVAYRVNQSEISRVLAGYRWRHMSQ